MQALHSAWHWGTWISANRKHPESVACQGRNICNEQLEKSKYRFEIKAARNPHCKNEPAFPTACTEGKAGFRKLMTIEFELRESLFDSEEDDDQRE
jgi:hypothetical protein